MMSSVNTYVRARIDPVTKERAEEALEAMGLSISDAIRLLMRRIADDRCLPFEVRAASAITRAAITELEAGKGQHFNSIDDLMADLNADD
ncbi:type II toxin-antitoxin system RelB/DinJ family antitoxin [Chromatium okenii]|uniref:type II toxin-antitoxin system RelB/DinJ family antitoxin n=1 Tax=Chromatium okenii TaxID=61644 RepID=UPI001904DE1F